MRPLAFALVAAGFLGSACSCPDIELNEGLTLALNRAPGGSLPPSGTYEFVIVGDGTRLAFIYSRAQGCSGWCLKSQPLPQGGTLHTTVMGGGNSDANIDRFWVTIWRTDDDGDKNGGPRMVDLTLSIDGRELASLSVTPRYTYDDPYGFNCPGHTFAPWAEYTMAP